MSIPLQIILMFFFLAGSVVTKKFYAVEEKQSTSEKGAYKAIIMWKDKVLSNIICKCMLQMECFCRDSVRLFRNGCLNKEMICCVTLDVKEYSCKVDAIVAETSTENRRHVILT